MIRKMALYPKRKTLSPGLAGLFLILIFSAGCSILFLSRENREIKEHLSFAEELAEQGLYEQALGENRMILEKYPQNRWRDKVLFNLGTLYAYYSNPGRNFDKARIYFQIILQEFPQSPFQQEALVWLAILNELKLKENEINKNKEELDRKEEEIDSLRRRLLLAEEEKSEIIMSMSEELLLKEKEAEEFKKTIQNQEKAIERIQAQIKQIKEIDIQHEEKKKDSKE